MTLNYPAVSSRKPKMFAPAGACDCHMHIYDPRFPAAPTAVSPPPEAPLEAYQGMRRQLGLTRAVVVQPSAYGTDNRCTMEAFQRLGEEPEDADLLDLLLYWAGDDAVRSRILVGNPAALYGF